MEGSESPDGGGSSSNRSGPHLGVNKLHSNKMSKVVKRNVIQQPKPHAPVYNIDKNDFRNIVQKLTGPPAPIPPPPPPVLLHPSNPTSTQTSNAIPNTKQPPNPRLHRIRPPPLQPVFSFNKLMPNAAPLTSISFPSHSNPNPNPNPNPSSAFQFSAPSSPMFSPLPPLTPSDAVWANTPDPPNSSWPNNTPARPIATVPRHDMTGPIGFPVEAAPYQQQASNGVQRSMVQYPAQLPPARSPTQFQCVSPLPSPASQLSLAFPFSPAALFPLSPSGAAGPLPLPPPSPGSFFPLSPAARFPFPSF
eukprot:Gb_06005 [translate_table: standard]